MTTLHSEAIWQGGVRFVATEGGRSVLLDAEPALGGGDDGVRPKGLLLTALIGCTGMDVARTLQKMRVPIASFAVRADGDVADRHPARYTAVRLTYAFTGPEDLSVKRIRRAIQLSTETYCGVFATLSAAMPITVSIEINGERIDAVG